MNVTTNTGIKLLLRPARLEDAPTIAAGMQFYEVIRHLSGNVQTVETEIEWIKKMATDEISVVWIICIVRDNQPELPIGVTSLVFRPGPIKAASSGIVIFDRRYWRQGVASAAHLARTLFAFDARGAVVIHSGYDRTNHGSRLALAGVGYRSTGIEYYRGIVGGEVQDVESVMVVNPQSEVWNYFWRGRRVPKRFQLARGVTVDALDRARSSVTY